MDRRGTVEAFRDRLGEIVRRSGQSRSAFAVAAGIDRSTLSQLLSADAVRLPRAETLVAIAQAGRVSVDWLLGLSQEGTPRADLVEERVAVEPGGGDPGDPRLERWHAEAVGYKIRYVPTTLPDFLKSPESIRYEYRRDDSELPEGRVVQAEARLAYSRRPETDIEICSSYQSVEAFALGHAPWAEMPPAARRAQLESMVRLLDELYPTVRWFLFDARQRYTAPLTVFGPLRAALYVGDLYIVFNSTEHIRQLSAHFDGLIRAAVVQPPDVIGFIERLLGRIP